MLFGPSVNTLWSFMKNWLNASWSAFEIFQVEDITHTHFVQHSFHCDTLIMATRPTCLLLFSQVLENTVFYYHGECCVLDFRFCGLYILLVPGLTPFSFRADLILYGSDSTRWSTVVVVGSDSAALGVFQNVTLLIGKLENSNIWLC